MVFITTAVKCMKTGCSGSTTGSDEKVIFILGPLSRECHCSSECPWHIDSEMKGKLHSGVILNAMTQDSVADSLDRCMLGDLCASLPAGPQEQILTVYFSKLKATGRQQFLYVFLFFFLDLR